MSTERPRTDSSARTSAARTTAARTSSDPATAARPFVKAIRERKLLLGVVHLLPLPGSPRHSGGGLAAVSRAARADAESILGAGFDGYVLENFGDAPFFKEVPPHVVAAMTALALELPREDAVCGANVLRNDARAALAVAAAAGLDFIRVNVHTGAFATDQGIIEGDAARTTRERAAIAPHVSILADVAVKHAAPLAAGFDIAQAAREAAYRGLADALIVTGAATGSPASLADARAVREAVPDRPLLVGSGVSAETIAQVLAIADGVIVGTALKRGGNVEAAVDPRRAREMVKRARAGK